MKYRVGYYDEADRPVVGMIEADDPHQAREKIASGRVNWIREATKEEIDEVKNHEGSGEANQPAVDTGQPAAQGSDGAQADGEVAAPKKRRWRRKPVVTSDGSDPGDEA